MSETHKTTNTKEVAVRLTGFFYKADSGCLTEIKINSAISNNVI